MVNEGWYPGGASINAACRRQKNHTTGLRPSEMHPFCLRHLSAGKRLTRFSVAYGSLRIVFACHPGGGGLLSASLSANLSRSLLSAAKTSPSGGSTAAGGDRGAFPTPAGRLYGFYSAKRNYKTHRSKGRYHHPLNPPAASEQNPLNLLNPGRGAAPLRHHHPFPLWYFVPPFPRKRWHNESSGSGGRSILRTLRPPGAPPFALTVPLFYHPIEHFLG